MLTSGVLNLLLESIFVLVVILLVMLALHALAATAAFACAAMMETSAAQLSKGQSGARGALLGV